MEVQIEEIGPCRNRLRITVAREQVAAAYDKQFRSLKNAVRLKGFRPGKVPQSYLQRRFGTELAEQVKVDLVQDSVEEAIKNHRLEPLGRPEVDLSKILFDPEQELVFEVVVEVRPSFELGRYIGIEVERPAVAVSDEEVEAELARVCERYATLEPVTADTPPAQQVLLGTVSVIVGDRKVIADRPVAIGPETATVAGIRVENLRARALAAGVGATLPLDVTLPSYFADPALRGQPGKVILGLLEARRLALPAADDALAHRLDFEDLAELRSTLRSSRIARKEAEADRLVEERILDRIVAETPFSLPEGLLASETDRLVARLRLELEFEGKPPEEIDEALAKSAEQQRAGVDQILKRGFVLDAVGRKEKIFVTEDELARHFEAVAARDGRDPAEVRRHYEERELIPDVRYHLREARIRAFLREKAQIA